MSKSRVRRFPLSRPFFMALSLGFLLGFSPNPSRAGFWDETAGTGREWRSSGEKSQKSGDSLKGGALIALGSGLEWLGGVFGGKASRSADAQDSATLPKGREGSQGPLGWKNPGKEGGAGDADTAKAESAKRWASGTDWVKADSLQKSPKTVPADSVKVSSWVSQTGSKSAFTAAVGTKVSGVAGANASAAGFSVVKGKACEDSSCMGRSGSASNASNSSTKGTQASPKPTQTSEGLKKTPTSEPPVALDPGGNGHPILDGALKADAKRISSNKSCPKGQHAEHRISQEGIRHAICVEDGMGAMSGPPEAPPRDKDLQKGLEQIMDEAGAESFSRFRVFETDAPLLHNGEGDAWRHARANQETVQWLIELGYPAPIAAVVAWSAGTYHELEGATKGQPWDEFWMDMKNNWNGISAGLAGDDPDQIDDLLRQGKLTVWKPGLTPEQLKVL